MAAKNRLATLEKSIGQGATMPQKPVQEMV